eukprot:4208942-Pleurochrysis_carterae.AAC.1
MSVTRSEGQSTVDYCPDARSVATTVSEPAPIETLDRRTNQHVDLRITSNPRVLIATRAGRHSDRHARGLRTHGKHIGFVVDSGCTYHIHSDLRDLIHVRSCSETVSGVDGKPRPCVAVGDLPLTVRDSHNRLRDYTLTNVRCVPSMRDTLLSVGQLWSNESTDCHFGNVRALELPPHADGSRTLLPFIRRGGLFEWH